MSTTVPPLVPSTSTAPSTKSDTSLSRLLAERNELHERATKLQAFVDTWKFRELEHRQRYLLRRQLVVQLELLTILDERLELIGE